LAIAVSRKTDGCLFYLDFGQKNSRSWKGAAKATVISLMREITHFGQPDVLTKASDQRLMVNTVSVSRTDMQIVFIIIK